MFERAEILYPLFASSQSLDKIGPKSLKALEGQKYGRVLDLLFLPPRDGVARVFVPSLARIDTPKEVIVAVTIRAHQPSDHKSKPHRVWVDDAGTSFHLIFFSQAKAYLEGQLEIGQRYVISGRAERYQNQLQIVHPRIHPPGFDPKTSSGFEAIYPSVGGVAARTLATAIQSFLKKLPDLPEWLPEAIRKEIAAPSWRAAMIALHNPQSSRDLMPQSPARRRLALDELFSHQLMLRLVHSAPLKNEGGQILIPPEERAAAAKLLPFALTKGQSEVIDEIIADIAKEGRMHRLLQGDVGSGKTAVVFVIMAALAKLGHQSFLMAPTSVLATQHYEDFCKFAGPMGLTISLLTGATPAAEKRAIKSAAQSGALKILIGTHAIVQDTVQFAQLALSVTDEQHRFGVEQRKLAGDKTEDTNRLMMSATPIPRSLALVQFGHMEISALRERPKGRQQITTALINGERIEEVFEHLKPVLARGDQVFWVCPLVSENVEIERVAVEMRYKTLVDAFGAEGVAMVHGQMKDAEKNAALHRFSEARTAQILVATTVIEVGVDVPSATIIVIEGAQSFGLAQLHQLRGRVGRGDKASHCLLVYDPPLSPTAQKRLKAMRDMSDGFELAELDLKLRGEGDILGLAQAGLPRFRIADPIADPMLSRLAIDAAKWVMSTNPRLQGDEGKAIKMLLNLMDFEEGARLLTSA